MAFFLETLLGGLMAGMLYSLVALGFVLIFKASGVFNFAQGAMVLFGALSMARFSEWIPQWTGVNSLWMANVLAFIMAAVVMFIVAWAVEYLVLRHLVARALGDEELGAVRVWTVVRHGELAGLLEGPVPRLQLVLEGAATAVLVEERGEAAAQAVRRLLFLRRAGREPQSARPRPAIYIEKNI